MCRASLAALAVALAPLATACTSAGAPGGGGPPAPPPPPPAVELAEEAGFVDIEPITVGHALAAGVPPETTTPPARIFYAFQPADEAPDDKPLFVLCNGGPGFATTIGLFAANVARRSLDLRHNGGGAVGPSPSPWTAMGSLLFLDARQTGFSYDRTAPDAGAAARAATFTAGVYNPYVDAADAVRAVLRFLAAHPAMAGRPVILVAESYGGTRAAAMLQELQDPGALEPLDAPYRDPALAAEVRAHFAAVRPGEPLTPDLVASQFGRQILIEPVVVGSLQTDAAMRALGREGSPLPSIAAGHGLACAVCPAADPSCDAAQAGRDCLGALLGLGLSGVDLSQTTGAVAAQMASAEAALRRTSDLAAALGVDPRGIAGLPAPERAGAFRFGAAPPLAGLPGLAPTGDEPLAADLGALESWDHYFVGFDTAAQAAANQHALDWTHGALWGPVFLANLPRVKTFITSARFDWIHPPAIADAVAGLPGVTGASLDQAPRPGVARPGWMTVEQTPEGAGAPVQSVVRMPSYDASGHSVSAGQPVELAADVAAWLAEE